MRLNSIMMSVFERFADRPAIAERAPIPTSNAETDTFDSRTLETYVSLTYGELSRRVSSVVAQLVRPMPPHHAETAVEPGDALALLGFAGADFVTVDFACNRAGITTVPLQTSGTFGQQSAILHETSPRALAVSVSLLDRAADLIHAHPSIERVLLLDYRGGNPDHVRAREAFQDQVGPEPETLDLSRTGFDHLVQRDDPAADAAMLLYTSGSTGSPKGAVYTGRLVAEMWGGAGWSDFFAGDLDVSNFHYMPMSHVAGHSSIRSTLARGGVTYFASTTNLSSFFDDLGLARPTELSLVPRVCELMFQEYQRRLRSVDTGAESGVDEAGLASSVRAEMRTGVLGGRVQWASCTSAPVSEELKKFMEELLAIEVHELYGTTEIGGVMVDGEFLTPPVIGFRLEDVPELGYYSSDRPHARGELLVRSTSTIPGYFNRPELNQEIFTDDGFYRTGDIAAVDDSGKLRIIDRKNAIIKLSQGEFVALPSLEATYTAGSPLIFQVFLYSESDQTSILAVVVPSDDYRGKAGDDPAEMNEELVQEFRRVAGVEGLNSYEVPSALIIELEPFTEANGLLSDHRKPVRPRLVERYGTRLVALYDRIRSSADALLDTLRDSGAQDPTITTVTRVAAVSLRADPGDIGPDARFRDLGGDSLTAVHASRLLEQIYDIRVPVDTIVSQSSTIRRLAEYVDAKRSSGERTVSYEQIHGSASESLRADDLRLSSFLGDDHLHRPRGSSHGKEGADVLITGAGGYLGRFLCLAWLRRASTTNSRVICLVRASDDDSAASRLRDVFKSDTALLSEFDELSTHLEVLAGDLAEPRLGLDELTWDRLTRDVQEIVHAGAMVNHALPYEDLFAANVVGTAEVIRLATTDRVKPVVYMSSIATALLDDGASPLDEHVDIREALPAVHLTGAYVDGYAATKWAGEVLLREAHDHHGLPVTVFRSSMILAHSEHRGQINVPDTFTRLLYSLVRTGVAPSSFYTHDGGAAHYDGLPVDTVAASIAALGHTKEGGFTTYHLVNPFDDGVSPDRMVDWLAEGGVDLTRIDDHADWYRRFEAGLHALPESERRASILPLLANFSEQEAPVNGSLLSSARFMEDLRKTESAPLVASLGAGFVDKCVADLEYVFGLSIERASSAVNA